MLKLFTAVMLSGGILAAAPSERNDSAARTRAAVAKAMEKEKKYAREQKFYQSDEYDFKGAEVDPSTLKNVPVVTPDYEHTDDWGACDSD
jgi:DNA invertase Pin-like site-specific DNA recombinase